MCGNETIRKPSCYSPLSEEEIEYDGGNKASTTMSLVVAALVTTVGVIGAGACVARMVTRGFDTVTLGFSIGSLAFGGYGAIGMVHNIDKLKND